MAWHFICVNKNDLRHKDTCKTGRFGQNGGREATMGGKTMSIVDDSGKIGRALVEKGKVSEEDLEKALFRKKQPGWEKLGTASILILMGKINRDQANQFLKEQTGGNKRITDTEQVRNLKVSQQYPLPD
ncbi:MAG: hypothetical protein WC537_00775 [Candidatus Paceibacterota bacterium]